MSATVDSLRKLDGFLAAALVDSSSGMMLESVTNGNFPVEVAAAANTDVMQAKLRAMDAIDLGDDTIEDMLHYVHLQTDEVINRFEEKTRWAKLKTTERKLYTAEFLHALKQSSYLSLEAEDEEE